MEMEKGKSMGTVTVGISKNDLFSDIQAELVEQLGLGLNPKLGIRDRFELKLEKKQNYMICDGYDRHTYGFVKNKYFFIASNPSPFFYKLHDFRVTIHLSQWRNIKEVIDSFCNIFGALNTERIFNKGDMLRLDLWLDTECSHDFLKQSIYRKGISSVEKIRGELKTCYYGAKKPNPALFYEKLDLDKGLIDIKVKNSKPNRFSTRIEIRFFRPVLPIKHFSDYGKLAEMDLFSKLLTASISREKFYSIESQFTKIRATQFKQFLSEVYKEGLHSGWKKFNKNRDFKYTIQPILNKCSTDLKLSERWRNKVRRRLVGSLDIKQYLELKISQEGAR